MPWLMPNGVGFTKRCRCAYSQPEMRGEQRGVDEHDDLEARSVDADRLGHRGAALQRADRAARRANRAGCCVAHSGASATAQIR